MYNSVFKDSKILFAGNLDVISSKLTDYGMSPLLVRSIDKVYSNGVSNNV